MGEHPALSSCEPGGARGAGVELVGTVCLVHFLPFFRLGINLKEKICHNYGRM